MHTQAKLSVPFIWLCWLPSMDIVSILQDQNCTALIYWDVNNGNQNLKLRFLNSLGLPPSPPSLSFPQAPRKHLCPMSTDTQIVSTKSNTETASTSTVQYKTVQSALNQMKLTRSHWQLHMMNHQSGDESASCIYRFPNWDTQYCRVLQWLLA